MKKTAVEFIIDNVLEFGLDKFIHESKLKQVKAIIKSAKALEKVQIIEAYRKGTVHGWEDEAYEHPNEYYNETFKSE